MQFYISMGLDQNESSVLKETTVMEMEDDNERESASKLNGTVRA